MSMPRISLAYSYASSAFLATLTPPALPRPPILTWALTTVTPPSFSAAAFASSGVSATIPASTGTPCASKRSRAWYSYRSTGLQSFYLDNLLNDTPGTDIPGRLRVRLNATELLNPYCSPPRRATPNNDYILALFTSFSTARSAAVDVFRIQRTVQQLRLCCLHPGPLSQDRKSTRLNSSHVAI